MRTGEGKYMVHKTTLILLVFCGVLAHRGKILRRMTVKSVGSF